MSRSRVKANVSRGVNQFGIEEVERPPVVFPALRALIDEEARAAILDEIRSRRR